MKYDKDNCPMNDDFYVRGGRCGWAQECKECNGNPKIADSDRAVGLSSLLGLPLEKQVCSLELAKRLKELGVKQNSLFYWANGSYYENGDGTISANGSSYTVRMKSEIKHLEVTSLFVSAFTSADLGNLLPSCVNNVEWYSKKVETFNETERKIHIKYIVKYFDYDEVNETEITKGFIADTEADVRAMLLVYLIKE